VNNAEQPEPGALPVVSGHDPELVYAGDVQIMAEPGGLQLTFTRPRPIVGKASSSSSDDDAGIEVIARIALPSLTARRLLRLLPERLHLQQQLAQNYARATDVNVASDPFLAALEDAEFDDEPYTDQEKAAVEAGWEEYQCGETIPWEEFRRELREEDEASIASAS